MLQQCNTCDDNLLCFHNSPLDGNQTWELSWKYLKPMIIFLNFANTNINHIWEGWMDGIDMARRKAESGFFCILVNLVNLVFLVNLVNFGIGECKQYDFATLL